MSTRVEQISPKSNKLVEEARRAHAEAEWQRDQGTGAKVGTSIREDEQARLALVRHIARLEAKAKLANEQGLLLAKLTQGRRQVISGFAPLAAAAGRGEIPKPGDVADCYESSYGPYDARPGVMPRRSQVRPSETIACPKCQETSGNDWRQCNGSCPMESSPHFDASASPNAGGAMRSP